MIKLEEKDWAVLHEIVEDDEGVGSDMPTLYNFTKFYFEDEAPQHVVRRGLQELLLGLESLGLVRFVAQNSNSEGSSHSGETETSLSPDEFVSETALESTWDSKGEHRRVMVRSTPAGVRALLTSKEEESLDKA